MLGFILGMLTMFVLASFHHAAYKKNMLTQIKQYNATIRRLNDQIASLRATIWEHVHTGGKS